MAPARVPVCRSGKYITRNNKEGGVVFRLCIKRDVDCTLVRTSKKTTARSYLCSELQGVNKVPAEGQWQLVAVVVVVVAASSGW